jgi:catechol 2,3-dioxygenase-like lactoylglutathione lyase family enzyme
MIGYTIFGANDLDRALAFYDQLMAAIGGKRTLEFDSLVYYGFGKGPMFAVGKPYDKQPATHGNGTMIALNVRTTENVHAIHELALKLGGSDEGAPGPRVGNGFYGAYFRDLDGNKICAFTMVRS